MAQHGKDTVVLHNQYNLTSSLDSASIDRSIAALDTTVFGLNSRTYKPGQKDGTISVEGFADPAAAGIDTILSNSFGSASTSVTVSLGQTAGSNAYLMDAIENQYSTSSSVTEMVRITGEYQAAQDGVDAGVLLLPVTTATSAGFVNGDTYDRGTATKTGAVGILHVTATDRTDADETMDVLIQHSASSDMSGATTLIAFTTGTTVPVAERVETTTDPLRYIRASYTIAGTTPSFTFAVSWAAR